MPVKKLKDLLDAGGIRYMTVTHSTAYTSQEIAASAHIPGKEIAKTVMVKLNGKMAMAVLPGSLKVDLDLLKAATGESVIELAGEQEFKDLFPGCEIGAMPPFGNLYGMEVFADDRLAEDEEIAFSAGSHHELIKLSYKDFEKLVKPKLGRFAVKPTR
ncbi:MAG: YbaK/EbsC family protein [Smithellaceae bacterium]|nr:YbaK/EbsC family protein [Smithellaceae bacterium]